jgi:inorganic pyrophosphatase
VRVVKVAASCKKGGAATNIIYGLALGYLSTIVPIFILASVIFIAFSLCDTCVALAVDRLPTVILCVCS